MNKAKCPFFPFLLVLVSLFFINNAGAQMITGVWKGKINRQKAELKIIQNGDSLTGTSYYYESANNFRRYSIKGYFDAVTNEAVWWDDQLLEEKSGKFSISSPGKIPLLSRADFNCPGGSKMMLDGKAEKEENGEIKGDVHLDKTNNPDFADEWDFIIDNYTVGTNDPDIIDSVAAIALNRNTVQQPEKTIPAEKPAVLAKPVEKTAEKPVQKTEPVIVKTQPIIKTTEPVKAPTIEEKFITRKKVLTTEIPVTGDSIELRFYDNAEIDGDSISLFLNDNLIFQHIRLLGSAYTIKLAVNDLKETNELIMVAENLGTIPPNTSYMVALVGDKRYDARLESTEGSSAMVRFIKSPH
jgi:hypothetical protein